MTNKMIKRSVRLQAGSQKDPVTGKRIQNRKWITIEAKNKTEFNRKLEAAKIAYREEMANITQTRTFAQLIDWYYQSKEHSPKTLANDQVYVEAIKNNFGKKGPKDITSKMILDYLDALGKEPYCYTLHTLHGYFKTLRKFFNFAIDEGLIARNPLSSLKTKSFAKQPKSDKSKPITEPIRKIINLTFNSTARVFDLKFKTMLLLSFDCCLRNAELYGIHWQDIDFEHKTINIHTSAYTLTTKIAESLGVDKEVRKNTKTERSTRTLPLSEETIKHLKLFQEKTDNYLTKNRLTNSKGYLFFQTRNLPNRLPNKRTRNSDAPLYPVKQAYGSGFNKKLKTICETFNIPLMSSHKVRIASSTLRDELGIQERCTEYVLGHSEGVLSRAYYVESQRRAKESHPEFEKLLNDIISNKNE